MDWSIMRKLLEDDEDETLRPDAEAFEAALIRDIELIEEGDVSALQLPPDSDFAVLYQGSNNTSSQSLPQLEYARQNESTAGQIQHDQNLAKQQELPSCEMELKQQHNISKNMPQQRETSEEQGNHFMWPQVQPHGDLQQRKEGQKPLHSGMMMSGTHPVSTQEQALIPKPENDDQYPKAQKMSSQQEITTEQPSTSMNHGKAIHMPSMLSILTSQLDKNRAMQVTALFDKVKNNEISKDAFNLELPKIVEAQILNMALKKVSILRSSMQQQQSFRMPSVNAGATQFMDPCLFAIQQRGVNPSAGPSNVPTVLVQTDSSHSAIKNSTIKLLEAECHYDPRKMQVKQMSSSCTGASFQERDRWSVPMQVHSNQQQQELHYSQSTSSMHGSTGGDHQRYLRTRVSTMPIKQQPHDSQVWKVTQHQSMGSVLSCGGETQGTKGGSRPHFVSSATLHKNQIPWRPPDKEQISGPSSSRDYIRQEPAIQRAGQQHRTSLSNNQFLPYASSVQLEQIHASSGMSIEKQSSRVGCSSRGSPSTPISSTKITQADPTLTSKISSGTPAGTNNRMRAKNNSVGQQNSSETLSSPHHPSRGKKQKLSGAFSDQSIKQLNDVTAVSGIDLREEEEQMFSATKEENRGSEASRIVAQEEEGRLILQKSPLQKKLTEIVLRSGLKRISHDVERCLSLCVEERMRGLINDLIRLSKQRVDAEKTKLNSVINSDIRQQILIQNKKAFEEWEMKQAEAEKANKLNKERNGKMRTKLTEAANEAVRAAVGGDDMQSKWQLMAEQARQKREGGIDVASGSHSGKGVNQEEHKRGVAASVYVAGTVRKSGENQVRVARSISIKDVISVLEREPQMSKSPLVYRLYEKI